VIIDANYVPFYQYPVLAEYVFMFSALTMRVLCTGYNSLFLEGIRIEPVSISF
jgi:hypothetical protein